MLTTLTDLDELVLRVRDVNSRAYIAEALAAHRSNLQRAATVLTWTATVYDLFAKIKELKMRDPNDLNAATFTTKLESAIQNNNTVHLQSIESGILDTAMNDFEFFGQREMTNLLRLRDDRHLCAHPAFRDEASLYAPDPELVRSHLAFVLQHVLIVPPQHGKGSLNRLEADLLRPSFPVDQELVNAFLNDRYLSRARPALLRQMIRAVMSALLKNATLPLAQYPDRLIRCLVAIAYFDPDKYEQFMRERLQHVADDIDDAQLFNVVRLHHFDAKTWSWLEPAVKTMIQTAVTNFTFQIEGWDVLAFAADIPELRDSVIGRFKTLESWDQVEILKRFPSRHYIEFAIKHYEESGSYAQAENLVQSVVLPIARHLSVQQLYSLLNAVLSNGQIWDAHETEASLVKIYKQTNSPDKQVVWLSHREQFGRLSKSYRALISAIDAGS